VRSLNEPDACAAQVPPPAAARLARLVKWRSLRQLRLSLETSPLQLTAQPGETTTRYLKLSNTGATRPVTHRELELVFVT
jgi:hypothetical protein